MATLNKPQALLGESGEAARLVMPDSDAERYFDGGYVDRKIKFFTGVYGWLVNPKAPRAGMVFTQDGGTVIQGETDPSNPRVDVSRYKLTIGNDGVQTIEIARISLEQEPPVEQKLGYIMAKAYRMMVLIFRGMCNLIEHD